MKGEPFPLEILEEVLGYLGTDDLCQCLLVNRCWNTIANNLLGGLHVIINAATNLLQDLIQYPTFAAKVTVLTIQSHRLTHWISVLKLCPNLSVLNFETNRSELLLERLNNSLIHFRFLEQINLREYLASIHLTACVWRHRKTLKSLVVYPNDLNIYRYRTLYDYLSFFPKLQDLHLNITRRVNLYKLLSRSKCLRKIHIVNADVFFDSRSNDAICLPLYLEEVVLVHGNIHFNALRFLLQIRNNLNRFEIHTNMVLIDKNQYKKELIDTLKDSPLTKEYKVLYISYDNKNYVRYLFRNRTL